jgi:hypothetical protein
MTWLGAHYISHCQNSNKSLLSLNQDIPTPALHTSIEIIRSKTIILCKTYWKVANKQQLLQISLYFRFLHKIILTDCCCGRVRDDHVLRQFSSVHWAKIQSEAKVKDITLHYSSLSLPQVPNTLTAREEINTLMLRGFTIL